jgi:hypothetical protein
VYRVEGQVVCRYKVDVCACSNYQTDGASLAVLGTRSCVRMQFNLMKLLWLVQLLNFVCLFSQFMKRSALAVVCKRRGE